MLDAQDCCPPVRGVQLALLREVLAAAAGVLVADYGRGVAAHAGVRAALTDAARGRPLVWDPHPRGAPPVRGTRVVTPNRREAAHFAGVATDGPRLAEADAARALLTRWGPVQVAITCGDRGAVLQTDLDSPPLVVPAPVIATRTGDPCGAGDRFAGRLTAALAAGRLPTEAVTAAVAAASRYVADGGPATLDAQPRAAADPARVGGEPPDAIERARSVRAAGGTVVATGGCFDLVHLGHVQMLEHARRLGDCLIVCLNSDESIARIKGPSRPIVAEHQRAAILAAFESVDAVLIFDEDTPEAVLSQLRPHIWVKGGDYSAQDLPEAERVRALGGRTVLVPYVAGRSTTSLIDDAVRARRGAGQPSAVSTT